MTGKTVVITVAGNSGLGLVTAKELAGVGADVRIDARNAGRGAAAVEEIDALGEGRAGVYVADLSSLDDVVAWSIRSPSGSPGSGGARDNAGALLAERKESVDGHEMTFATMYILGPFLLTNELLPLLRATPAAGHGSSGSQAGACTPSRSNSTSSRWAPRTIPA